LFETALAEYSDRNNGEVRSGLFAGGRWIRTIGTPEREAYFFPGRNSLAGTASRRGRERAKLSAYSNVSNGAEREPPDLRSAFWRVRMPSGRVSRWPQPALFAQYSQVRQVKLLAILVLRVRDL